MIVNEWLYPFIAVIINIHGSSVLVGLCGCCMAGAMWNAAVSTQVLWTPFNHAPGYSVTDWGEVVVKKAEEREWSERKNELIMTGLELEVVRQTGSYGSVSEES